MILGETKTQKRDRLSAWVEAFAYLPTKLSDGRFIWWETYFVRYSGRSFDNGPGVFMRRFWQRVKDVPEAFDFENNPPPPRPKW